MQHTTRTLVPSSNRSPLASPTKPSALKQKVLGLGFDAAEQALRPPAAPMPVGKPPAARIEAPDPELGRKAPSDADRITTAISGATATFEKEKADAGEETYLQKHERHQRNKDLKKGLEHLPKAQREQQYKEQRERSPDRQRRDANAKLKQDLKAQGGGKLDVQEYAYEREYAGGPAKTEKARGKIDRKRADARIEADNAALLLALQRRLQAGEAIDVQALYAAQRQKTTKDIAKDEKRAKEDATLSLYESINPLRDDDIKKKADDIAAKERQAADLKKQAKAEDKAAIAHFEQACTSGAMTWEQAASAMKLRGLGSDALRKQWNTRVKGEIDRALYRDTKLQRGEVAYERDKGKKIKNATTYGDKVLGVAGSGAVTSGLIARATGDTQVAGTRGVAASGQNVTTGGTANQAGGVIGGINGIVGAVNATDKIHRGLTMRNSNDGAERQEARTNIVDGTLKLGTSAASGTTGILKSVQAFTSDPAVAAAMQLEAVPVVGIVGASINLVSACVALAAGAERIHQGGKLRAEAKERGRADLSAALKGTRSADIQLVTSSAVDVVTSLSAIIGHSLTLGGVTGPAGVALVGLSAGVSAVKSLGQAVYASEEARQAKKSQVKYAQAVKGKKSDAVIAKRGEQLITKNIQYAIQVIIAAGRDGDPTALGYLQMFGLDTKDFSQMEDENIRSAILAVIDKEDEPETILDQLEAAPGKLRGGWTQLKTKTGLRKY